MPSVSSFFTFLLILSTTITILSPSVFADSILYPGETLTEGQSLTYGSNKLTMQSDCNLVCYVGSQAKWSTGTKDRGSSCFARLQKDGNFVVYDGSVKAVWASNTARGQGNYILVLQKDSNVVIYGGAIWAK